jgi:DNA-binding beta-propeller fold protein YncE
LAWARRISIGAIALTLAPALSGCGGGLPPAAEPADAPVPAEAPAGTVFPIGGMPEGLVFDPASRLLFAGLREPARLAAIDPSSGRVLRVQPLPAPPRHLSVAPGGDVLVPAEDANELIRVSPGGRREAGIGVGEHPHDATAAAVRDFVADEFGDSISVVQGDRVIATVDAPQQPGGIAAVAGRYVAVVGVRERVLEVYDAETLTPTGETDAGEGPTHAISLGDSLLVADTEGNALLLYRLAPRPEPIARTPLTGVPYGLAFDPRRDLVWVTLTARNRVDVLRVRGDRLEPVAGYPTVRQPNSVAVDPRTGTGWIAGRSAGALERIPLGGLGGRP